MARAWTGLILVFVLTSLTRQALAAGEQGGRLRGRVIMRGTGVLVHGARVEVSGETLIGGPRSLRSDEQGRFDFVNLPPGPYLITVSLAEVRPVRHRISVALGQAQEIEVPLAAEAVESETHIIIEERRRLDRDRLATGAVLTAEQQGRLPTRRTYQDIVQQVPGVVGGSNPIMAGATHNHYLVDGLDVTDPVIGFPSGTFNFDAIAQVDVQVAPVDAQYVSPGGVVNLITKTGSDHFHADASFYFNHQALSAGGQAGTQLYEGRRLDQSAPRPAAASYQANINLSGPILRHRLWFYAALEYRYALSSVVPGPPLNVQHPSQIIQSLLPRLKLTWAVARRHRIDLSFNADFSQQDNQRQRNNYTGEAEFSQRNGGLFGVLNWDWFITDHLLFNLQTGVQATDLIIGPTLGDANNSYHADRASTITYNATDAILQDDQRWRVQFDPTLKWIKNGWLGTHTFKAGMQISYLRNYRLYGVSGNQGYVDHTNQSDDRGVLLRDPNSGDLPIPCNPLAPNPVPGSAATPCFQVRESEPRLVQYASGWSLSWFLQDVWRPMRRLTLTLGLRIDHGISRNNGSEVVQNLLGFGPRLGASVDLTGDGRTLLKLSYARANEVDNLSLTRHADATSAETDWNYDRRTGRFDQFSTTAGGTGGYDLRGRCADGPARGQVTLACGNAALSLFPPHSDTAVASIERDLHRNVIGSVTYTYRRQSDQWERIELNARRTLDGGDYAASANPRLGNVYAYRPGQNAFRRYNGVDFALTGDPGPCWSFRVAYTLAFLDGNYENVTANPMTGSLGYDPPRDFRQYGYLADDHRHQIKLQGSWAWRGLQVGVNLTYLSGAPATRLYETPLDYTGRYAWRGVDPGKDPNDIHGWTELRSPDVLAMDLRVQYDLHGLIKHGQHFFLIADLFNVLNLSTPVADGNTAGFENRDTALYGTVLNRQAPLRAQLGLRYQY